MNDRPTPLNGPDPDSERLRRMLSDAVDDLEPRDALGTIHARTKVSSMNSKRSWILGAAAAVVATAATVTAVVVLSDGTTGNGDAGPAASATPTPTPSPSAEPTPTEAATPSPTPTGVVEAVPVYYAADTSRGTRLYREFHRIAVADGERVTAAVNEAVAGAPADADYRTDWPAATAASQVDGTGTPDVITIDVSGPALHDRPAGMAQEDAEIAVQQLVYTAQAADQSRKPVQFLLNSGRTDTLLGVPVSEPLAQADQLDVLAQVWIIEPGEGAEVSAPFEVSGLAAAFEANVQWELRQGDTVVVDGFTTAEECCTMAPYSFQVDGVAPGDYTLVVRDSDPSGGEGPAPWEDTKQITVR